MVSLFKVSLHFNQIFKNRGGRFLTVYKYGQAINGKIIGTNPLWATIQPAAAPYKRVRVLNLSVKLVSADHVWMSIEGNVDRRVQAELF